MKGNPVCLIQWLAPRKSSEVADAWANFTKTTNISPHAVSSKSAAIEALSVWLATDNAQFLYIGSHGIRNWWMPWKYIGIGRRSDDFFTWDELGSLLMTAREPPVVWLGACGSSAAARAWTPIGNSVRPAARLTTFANAISPQVCAQLLDQCLKDTGMESGVIVHADEELPRLRNQLPCIKVQQFYPAKQRDGVRAYVNIDHFVEKVGVDFETYLDQRSIARMPDADDAGTL